VQKLHFRFKESLEVVGQAHEACSQSIVTKENLILFISKADEIRLLFDMTADVTLYFVL
jgi:hypothetical protein